LNFFTHFKVLFFVFWECSGSCLMSEEIFSVVSREQFYRRRSANYCILGVGIFLIRCGSGYFFWICNFTRVKVQFLLFSGSTNSCLMSKE
jgi:hypothetical protein